MIQDLEFKKIVDERIEQAKQSFIAEFNPERVMLFGSFARGKGTKKSSIDMLIVASISLPFYERIKKAISVSRGDPPIEPLVYTPEEINVLLSQGDYFIENILKEGILLYSR